MRAEPTVAQVEMGKTHATLLVDQWDTHPTASYDALTLFLHGCAMNIAFSLIVFLYAVLTSFVLASARRNAIEGRPNGPALLNGARLAFGFSIAAGVLLFGWAALVAMGMAPVVVPY